MNKETLTEVIALLNTANYDTETLNQKRDDVVKTLKEQLSHLPILKLPETIISDFITKYNKGLIGNERIHEDCLNDYLQDKL